MNLLAISISHHTAPVELREALYLTNDEIKEVIEGSKGKLFSEGLVISTCNRTEIYGIPVDPKINYQDVQNFILIKKPVPQIHQDNFRNFFSKGAVKHLFRLISGIDSMLIGDNQIYHQVKDSFQFAEVNQFTGFLMRRLFDAAVKTGKRAISETEISEGAVTVSYAAVQLIEKIFSSLNKKSALVIGAGETGEIAAKHLLDRGIGKLAITNRTVERAEKLAESLSKGFLTEKAKIIPFTTFKEYIHEYDIILSATSSENFILTKDDIQSAMKKRSKNAMVLMDIAIPRDIDPEAKKIDNVFCNDIDSLNIIVEQNLAKRKEEIPKVEKIVEEELANFFNWFSSLELAPTIKNLRDFFESIRAEEVDKNKNRFSQEDQEKLEIVTKRIIIKILHHPTTELKKFSENNKSTDEAIVKVSIIRELFGMDKQNNPAAAGEEKGGNS